MRSSTRSPIRTAVRALRGAVLTVALVLSLAGSATPAAAQEQGQAQAVAVPAGTRDGRSRLTVALPDADGAAGPEAFSVTVDGTPQPADVVPLLSDRTATAVVVDASAAGGAVLQPGLSGAASFVLATPPAARSALVADTAPPAVVSPLQVGPADTLRGLAVVRAGGSRQTGVAVELALNQLRPGPDGPRVVLLYTGAPDAMGLPAADLVAHLRAAGAVLAVVAPGTDGAVPPYWSEVAAGTGGVAVAARGSRVISAFDALVTALRARRLVTFPAPARLPAAAVVRVDTARGQVVAATEVPSVTAAPGAVAGHGAGDSVDLGFALVALLVVGTAVAAALRRPGRAGAPDGDARGPDRAAAPSAARTAPTGAWNVPDRLDPVADRTRLSAALRRALRAGPVVLHPDGGATGVGTTTAMIELAHRERDDHDIAWFVPAADPPLVADRLAELAELVGLAAPTDTAEAATDRLLEALRHRGRWLLIFDDAGCPRQLARFLPPGPGHVLIGSSDPEWAQHASPVAVAAFTRAESAGLLRSRCPGLSAAEADRVAAALDDMPSAVDLAGATLAGTELTVETYLGLLDEQRPAEHGSDPRPKRGQPAGPAPSGNAAAAACAVALDRLGTADPPAVTLLTLLAWLGPEPVPLSLLGEHPELLPAPLPHTGDGPDRLDDLLALVTGRGLARLDTRTDARAVALHPIPAAVLVTRSAADAAGAAGWAATAVRLLRAAVPADATDPAGWPTWRRLLPHVLAATDPERPLDGVLVEVGGLLEGAACYLRRRGEPRAARALFEDAYDLYRRRLGPDHPDTLLAARTLADDLLALGDNEHARRVLHGVGVGDGDGDGDGDGTHR
jgi:hypothetical protein